MNEAHGILEGAGMEYAELSRPRLLQELREVAGHALLREPVVVQEVDGETGVMEETLETRVHEASVAHVPQAAHAPYCIRI